MAHDVTFLLPLFCWKIIINDLNHQTIDSPGVSTTLLGAVEESGAVVPTQPHHW